MSKHFALAIGCGTQNRDDQWLEVFYPNPLLNPASPERKAVRKAGFNIAEEGQEICL